MPKRPCIERVDAPLPARRPTEAYPLRYGEGGQRRRSGCSGPRMPGSERMDPGRPERRLAGASQVERRSERPPSEDAEAGQDAPYLVTQPRRATQGRKSS